jgi:Kef-type K+ transport system membrane component KefB
MTRFSTRESLKIGISMTPRGEMGLIIASLGLTSGLISTGTYSVAVMAVILTTFIALPIIKKVYETKITRFPRASEIYASLPRIPKRKIKDENTEEKNKMTEQ